MLVLTRKKGESILIGEDIEITIVQSAGEQIKIGINAPKNKQIIRKELLDEVKQINREALIQQDNVLETLKKLKIK